MRYAMDTSNRKNCAFIILTYNSSEHIGPCLDSVLKLECVKPYVFLYDNGSKDNTLSICDEYSEKYPKAITIHRSDKNDGTTMPRNACIALAQMSGVELDYVTVLDSDTIVNEAAIAKLKTAVDSNPKLAIATPRMFNLSLVEQMSLKKFPSFKTKFYKAFPSKKLSAKGEANEKYEFFPAQDLSFQGGGLPPVSEKSCVYYGDYAISACWFMRMESLNSIGLLDEKYFYAPEDADYCATAKEKGFEIALVSDASIYHVTQRISKRKLISKMNLLHLMGLVRFARKHSSKLKRLKNPHNSY